MQRTVNDWQEFRGAWDGVRNFLMAGECVPFAFDFPPLEEVVDEIRRDPDARIVSGLPGAKLDMTDIAAEFRSLTVAEAIRRPFALAHFKLANFYAPGRLFHRFEERVMEPWRQALTAAGFTWTRCYPIIFISGAGCTTNYHMDMSHVVAWQVEGTKRFCGLQNPDQWAPSAERLMVPAGDEIIRPAGITEADVLAYDMRPGDVLWNCLLTPHWVEAADTVAYSINLSHGGLRLAGRLAPHEDELEQWRETTAPM